MCRASQSPPSCSNGRDPPKPMSSSTKKERRPTGGKPAFEGAKFDKDGMCLKHGAVQLAERVEQDGRLLWKELRNTCPKCASEHHKSRRVTSLGGAGKVKRGRSVHGTANPLAKPAASGRHRDKTFDTPFDDRGRCHHHPQVQMATKKVRGGWKILTQACPKCIEADYDEAGSVASGRSGARSRGRGGGRGGDDASVDSRGSRKRAVKTRTKPVAAGARHDKNGCCTSHPTVQIAKKKLMGGWKEYRTCPKCLDPAYDDMADNASVRSGTSFRSAGTAKSGRSRKSGRSVKSTAGGKKGGRKGDRYGALPFDGDGFCHAHPGVRLAKKKALGGWKVLHDICPDCAHDATSQAGSARSRSSRGTGRFLDDDGSDASSHRSTNSRKKKIRVKGMTYKDEHGREGKYSGDVDEDHHPHGQGKMKYRDGSGFVGVWSEGSQVHGKATKAKRGPAKEDGAADGDAVRGCGGGRDGAAVRTVRKMKWMDYYGDPGEYTGEVDARTKMPDGRGTMKYDHGLVQEGRWTGGQFVEGSDAAGGDGAARGGNGGGRGGRPAAPPKKSSEGREKPSDGRAKRSEGRAKPSEGRAKPSEDRASRGDRKKPVSARAPPGGRGLEP